MAGQLSVSDFLQIEKTQFTTQAHGLRLWDPRLKIALALVAMLFNVLTPNRTMSLWFLGVAFAGLVYSRCSWRQVLLFLMAPIWTVIFLVVGYSFGFGHDLWFSLGPLHFFHDGMAQGVDAGLRVFTEISWMALVILTTPFHEILEALRWYRIPPVLMDTLAFMYRYAFLLFNEYSAMYTSAKTRGGFSNFRVSASTSGQIAAQVFLRCYDRAQRISQAMQARGGEG